MSKDINVGDRVNTPGGLATVIRKYTKDNSVYLANVYAVRLDNARELILEFEDGSSYEIGSLYPEREIELYVPHSMTIRT